MSENNLNNKLNDELSKLREKIDFVDKEIVSLIEKRMDISVEVGLLKKKHSMKIFDKAREDKVVESRVSLLKNKNYEETIKEIYSKIMEMSRNTQMLVQKKLNEKELSEEKLNEEKLNEEKKLDTSKKNIIAFHGREGGYGYESATKLFPNSTLTQKKYFEDVLLAVENEEAKYGVLPVENSTTGIINEVLDILSNYNAVICGEYYLTIDHALLITKDANIKDIKKVFSHPQGIKQCIEFIKAGNFETVEKESTAHAAEYISRENNKNFAAIASEKNAEIYSLKVAKKNISDIKNNTTRFIIVKKNNDEKKNIGYQKMTVRFTVPHTSGSLTEALTQLKDAEINLTSIISRPSRDKAFEYYFYIDMTAELNNEKVLSVLKKFENAVYNFKVLGVYKEMK